MSAVRKASNEEIIVAYRETGTVWKAAKRLGMCGQSVWERLKNLGYPMHGSNWTDEETSEAVALARQGFTLRQISERIGRPYTGVAAKLSELNVRVHARRERKARRSVFKTPDNAAQWAFRLRVFGGTLRQFALDHRIALDLLVASLQAHEPDFWHEYARTHAVAPQRPCANCGEPFYPLAGKQRTCSRRCQSHHRVDRQYFGGNRNRTVGLAEGVCQLCHQRSDRLCSHHVLGKENDVDNEVLVALCHGCHQVVGVLAGRPMFGDSDGWERLIHLVMARRISEANRQNGTNFSGTGVTVEIDFFTDEELDSMSTWDALAPAPGTHAQQH